MSFGMGNMGVGFSRLSLSRGGAVSQGLFAKYGAGGFLFDKLNPSAGLQWQESSQTTLVSATGQPVGYAQSSDPDTTDASQGTDASRPTLTGGPPWYWAVDKAGDDLVVTIPTGGITGTYIQATDWGVAVYEVAASAGAFSQVKSGLYLPGTKIYAAMMIDAVLSAADKARVVAAFEALGAVDVFGSVTNFSSAWRGCSSLTAFPALDVSDGTSFNSAWYGCSSLTAFPALDVSSGTDFYAAWSACSSLTAFPALDVSAGTNFYAAWSACSSLTTFPALDVSAGTNFNQAWSACSSLTAFPALDVSSGTNFSNAWYGCSSLTAFPALDVSAGTSFNAAWYGCESLTAFPALDVSAGTNFTNAWRNCSSLTAFPALDVSDGTNFSFTWRNCSSLTAFPALDVSDGTNFTNAWQDCSSLTAFPASMFNGVTATNFTNAFVNCALTETSVDNILVSIAAAGTSSGTLNMTGGTSSAPSATGETAIDTLRTRSWTVTVVGGY